VQQRHRIRLEALRRIQLFIDEHADALGNLSSADACRALDETVTKLDALALRQREAQVDCANQTKIKHERREELMRRHMYPIAAIARVHLGATPQITDMQCPTLRDADCTLVAAATVMANAAATHRSVFTDQQLPADFVRELRSAADALKQAVVEQDGRLTRMKMVTREIADEFAESARIRAVLNALMEARLYGDAERLEAWKVAKRVSSAAPPPTAARAPAAERPCRPRDRAGRERLRAGG
jgi:hypothetical protein